MIIYKATNTINGKFYIGKTKGTLEKRIQSHKLASNKKKWLFYNAIKKYGFHNFKWEIIFECDDIDLLNKKEKEFISKNINGYNIAEGGTGGDTFSNNPKKEALRANVSKFHKGKKLTDEHKKKISDAHKGKQKPWASETAKKMSESLKGKKKKFRPLSEETKRKISESNKGKKKPMSDKHKESLSKAKKGWKNPNKGKTYEEIMGVDAAKRFKIEQSKKRTGRILSEETKRKISESHKKRNNGTGVINS